MMITADAGHLWCRIHGDHRRVMTSAVPLWPSRPVNHRQGARDPSRTVLAELQWPRSSHPHQPMKLTLQALMTAGRLAARHEPCLCDRRQDNRFAGGAAGKKRNPIGALNGSEHPP